MSNMQAPTPNSRRSINQPTAMTVKIALDPNQDLTPKAREQLQLLAKGSGSTPGIEYKNLLLSKIAEAKKKTSAASSAIVAAAGH